MNLLRSFLVAAACLAAVAAHAQAAAEPEGLQPEKERARIAAERGQIEKRFAGEEEQCYRKFAVNDCIQESRKRRREELADLRRQELSLNDAQRKRRAAEQIQRADEKQSAERQQDAAEQRRKAIESQQSRVRSARRDEEKHQRMEDNEAASRERQQRLAEQREAEAAQRAKLAAEAPSNRERYERKLKDAAEYKAKRDKRNAERTKPPAAALTPAS